MSQIDRNRGEFISKDFFDVYISYFAANKRRPNQSLSPPIVVIFSSAALIMLLSSLYSQMFEFLGFLLAPRN